MTDRHPSPDQLIAFLDGECARATRTEIERHLKQCWKCRSKAAAIERTINGLVAEVHSESWPSDGHQQLAGQRLAARIQQLQGQSDGALPYLERSAPRSRCSAFRTMAPVAAALLVVAAIALGSVRFRSLLVVEELKDIPLDAQTSLSLQFAHWEQTELLRRAQTGAWRGDHQVRIAARDEATRSAALRLETLNHGRTGDYHLRLRPPQGAVRFATWQPGPDPRFAYLYQQRKWGRLVQLTRGTGDAFRSLSGGAADSGDAGLDRAVFQWVQAMVFHSHLPTRRFARMAALPGTTVYQTMYEDRPWVCVEYHEEALRMVDCLDAGSPGGQVLREWLRVQVTEAGGETRSLDVLLDWTPAQPVAASALYESDFLPPGLRTLDLARARRRAPLPASSEPGQSERQQLLAVALDAEEAILVLSAIEGPEFAVDLDLRSDAVVVHGRVASQEQFEALEASILPLTAHSPLVRFEVQVAETAPLPPAGETMNTGSLPGAAPLAAAVLAANRPSLSKEELRDLCNRAIRLSGNVVVAARRVASMDQRYGAAIRAEMPPAERDRLAEIRGRQLRNYRLALADLHQFFLQSGLDAAPLPLSARTGVPDPLPDLDESVRRLHAGMLRMFAVGQAASPTEAESMASLTAQVRALLRPEAASQLTSGGNASRP